MNPICLVFHNAGNPIPGRLTAAWLDYIAPGQFITAEKGGEGEEIPAEMLQLMKEKELNPVPSQILPGQIPSADICITTGFFPGTFEGLSAPRRFNWTFPNILREETRASVLTPLLAETRIFAQELIQTFRSQEALKGPLGSGTWDRYYNEGNTKWDLEEVSPPLARLAKEGKFPKGKMVIPGFGTGHEVLYFAGLGYEVTGIDYARKALEITEKKLKAAGLQAELLQADFLSPAPELEGKFDILLEQACYCAIEPARRIEYVRSAEFLLKQGGEIAGLFYDIFNPEGPPFGTTREEVECRFSPSFDIELLELTDDSHSSRAGKEWLGRFRKKSFALNVLDPSLNV
ncbi:MAG TPA: methyltransferase domain-containing protein [Nitrospiria bacterium]|nr:methyltransferase domain-containing protein [Nitrospiria bacterium]